MGRFLWPIGFHCRVNAIQVKCFCPVFLNDFKHPFQPTFSGLVPSSVVLTAFQVASRLFLTWAIAHSVPQVSTKHILCSLV